MKRVKRAFSLWAKTTVGAFAVVGALTGASVIQPREVTIERAVEVPVERKAPDIKTLVKTVPPKYGISPLLAAAIIERESGAKRDALRYEPGQMERARVAAKQQRLEKRSDYEAQVRALSSSFGVMQVMGWHAARFNLSWADLLDVETNIEVGCAILKECMDRHAGKPRAAQIRAALTCYNGSDDYALAVRDRLTDLLIEKDL